MKKQFLALTLTALIWLVGCSSSASEETPKGEIDLNGNTYKVVRAVIDGEDIDIDMLTDTGHGENSFKFGTDTVQVDFAGDTADLLYAASETTSGSINVTIEGMEGTAIISGTYLDLTVNDIVFVYKAE